MQSFSHSEVKGLQECVKEKKKEHLVKKGHVKLSN